MVTVNQLKAKLESPKNKLALQRAARHEERIRFHVDAHQGATQSHALKSFLKSVDRRLPKDKAQNFRSYLDFPIDTVSLTGESFNLLEKVYDGRDPVYHCHFTDNDIEEDWMRYRIDTLDSKTFWRRDAWSKLKSRHNSVMVVDLPSEQEGLRPEPYVYFVDVTSVIDYAGADDQFDWLVYSIGDSKYVHVDDTHFQVFEMFVGDLYAKELSSSEHGLGRCPARFFLTDHLKDGEKGVMRSPISGEVGNLDYLQFIMTSKKIADSHGSFPIYWQYTQECDFTREHHNGGNVSCSGGYLVTSEGINVMRGDSPEQCPVCVESSLTGAGSLIEVDPPSSKDDPLITPPAGIIQTDVLTLKYLVEEETRRRRHFITAVTGNPIEVTSDQAVNVTQVMSLMEQGKAAILKVKRSLEQAHQWVDTTICELRYGNFFTNCSVNYGTEFFMVSADMMLNLYIEARAKKLDGTILDGLLDQYYETKHRHAPEKIQREKVISHVDPFRHLWEDAVTNMYSSGYIDFKDYMTKVNLTSYIKRFERENGDITHFASQAYDDYGIKLSFDRKIARIRDVIKTYIDDPKQIIIEEPLNNTENE